MRLRQIRQQQTCINFSLHEVPSGILGNNCGLTPEEFQEHIDYLDEFEANLGHAGLFAHNEVYCKKCRRFYTSYRDYILHRRNGGAIESFDEYLEKNSTDDFAWPPSKESERWNAMPRFQFGPAESPFISL